MPTRVRLRDILPDARAVFWNPRTGSVYVLRVGGGLWARARLSHTEAIVDGIWATEWSNLPDTDEALRRLEADGDMVRLR